MGETYKVSDSPKIQILENKLATDLAELKLEIEESGILQGGTNTTLQNLNSRAVYLSAEGNTFTRRDTAVCKVLLAYRRSVSYFRKERELLLKKGLQVAEAKQLVIQADVMQRELESCLKPEYTANSLPFLLHQFFTDRIHQLVQCKYLHMLRWERFCRHTKHIEQLYPLYKKQISHIMKEYDDAVQRAQRLSIARECLLTEAGNPSRCVTQEDVIIYLQWLVCHFYSVTTIHNYLRALQYLPMSHQIEVTPEKLSDILADDEDKISIATHLSSFRVPTRPGTAFSSVSGSAGKSALLSSAGAHAISTFKSAPVMDFEGVFNAEVNHCLPVHVLKIEEFKHQLQYLVCHFGIEYDVDDIRSTANEMELFTLVIRKFRSIFSKEETMKTFPAYDAFEPGLEHWGTKGPSMTLKKEANWIPFLKIKPKQDPWQQKLLTKLKQQRYLDEILRLQAQFLQVSDPERVMDVLRQHAAAVHEPSTIQPLAVTSHPSGQNTSHIWSKIYGNAELYQELRQQKSGSPVDFSDEDVGGVNPNKCANASSKKNRDEGYNHTRAMQLLGLDEGSEENGKDPVMTQGAYLSLLFLRHLRIRELQRICLGTLNYFRSIERTLTINVSGLTLNRGKPVCTAEDTCQISAAKGGSGVTDGIGSHGYLHNTPADYKVDLTKFMEFSEIENHDDFYVNEDSFIHVQDQRGFFVMYDVALKDLKELETQLLLLATQYIEKGQIAPPAGGTPCGPVDLPGWARLSVDRFAVLLDLWKCETAFQEHKRQLLDGYFEAYQHVFDVEDRFALAQVITDIMYQRPRFNLSNEYFVQTYQAECTCLKLQLQLIRDMLNKQIDDQREYVQRIWRDNNLMEMGIEFGLPLNVISKQPVAINNSCPALKKIYLLEFHPSLGMAARIRQMLEYAYNELRHTHRPKTADECIGLEKHVLNLAIEKWSAMETPESTYSVQVQRDVNQRCIPCSSWKGDLCAQVREPVLYITSKDGTSDRVARADCSTERLFSGVFIEDPLFVRDVGLSFIDATEEGESRQGADKQAFALHTFCRLLEIITLRHRLMETASEAALLAQLYKSVAVQMGFDEFHLYLRPVQFEFATHKKKADQPPPVFITSLLDDDSSIDRYAPSSLSLAIQEVDENHIGKFSFRTKEAVLQLMARRGVENLQVALACQTVQKNSLLAVVQQALLCSVEKAAQPMDPKDRLLGYRSQDNLAGTNRASTARESESQQLAVPLGNACSLGIRKQPSVARKRPPEAFVSIQLEKLTPRDLMLNHFLQKKSVAGLIMKNDVEVEKIKRELILDYCSKFNERMSQYSLRSQIIAYYSSLLGLLQDFPAAVKTYFVLGQPQEKKGERDSELGLMSDPRKLHQRPRSLLSPDGRTFLNLWYIPHHSEVLIMFKTLEQKVCWRALYQTLEIVAALHDIFSYLCCFAQLGSSPSIVSQKMQPLAAVWGGLEGIGSELQEIQTQMDNLDNPRDPATVAKFLVLKRDVMFLQFDAAVRHSIREAFLSAGNIAAFQAVTDAMHQALPVMSNSAVSNLYGSLLPLPQPLDARNHKSLALFPWRAFLAREGFLPGMISNLQSIEQNMQMCLCMLSDRDLNVANGELLGVSLLMEDVVQSGSGAFLFPEKDGATCDETEAKAEEASIIQEKEDGEQSPINKSLTSSKTLEPISMYRVLKSFLILWKQLEVFKDEWGRLKLGVKSINSVTLYKQFCKLYRQEIMYPAMKPIAHRLGMEVEYKRMMLNDQPLLPPKGTSEMEIKTRQLHKLLESLEGYMIRELQKKIARELSLVMSERARGEASLPTDDWKHSVMTENFSITRPQIVEKFVQKLQENSRETESEITFSKDHLSNCLLTLACDVMGRERSNFETYSMCYENILRREHQLLYEKEQELKGMQQSQTPSATPDSQLAHFSHQIIIEITALRAKLTNLEEESTRLKEEMRNEVRQEYDALVRHLFASCFTLKQKLDDYHIKMDKVACKLISEVRRNGVENMIILKRKIGSTRNDDILKENLAWQDQLQSLREENSQLQRLVCQLKTLNCWRMAAKQEKFQRSRAALEQKVTQVKEAYLNIKILAEEEKILLQQQLVALRKALSRSKSENERTRKELEKEKQLLREYRHRAAQELKSRQQVESMKTSNMEQLLDDMQEKEQRLNILNNKLETSSKIVQIQYHKINKEIKQVRCQLSHERSLKLDAFQRVDELQSQMHNFEAAFSLNSVAGTGIATHSPMFSRDTLQRCLTTAPKNIDGSGAINRGGKRIQRPKTVPTRLHNKAVEALLPELEEPRYQSLILELKDYKLNQK